MGKVSNKNTNEYPVPEGSYLYLARKIADGVFASRKLPFEAAIQQIIESHTDQANPHSQYATQAAFAAHAADTGNPHGVTAAQVGADPVGTAAGAVAAHEAEPDPHPQYVVTWAEYNNGSDPVTAPEANFTDALALGSGAIAGATYAFAFLGSVTGAYGIAIGSGSSVSGAGGIAIGAGAATAGGSPAVGNGANSSGGATFGTNSDATGQETSAFGDSAQATGVRSSAFGNSATASGDYSTAIGTWSDATQNQTLAVGYNAQVTGVYSTGAGHGVSVSGAGATAFGRGANVTASQGIAIGDQAAVQNLQGIKIGTGELTVHEKGVCFGYYAGTAWNGQFVLTDLSGGTNYGRGGKKSFTTPAWAQTTSATPNVISIPVNTVYTIKAHRVEVEVLAHEPATDEVWTQKITGLLHDLVGTLTLVGTNSDAVITSGGLTVSAAISISGTSLNITVTGEAGKTINWYTCVADLNSRT